MPDSAVSAAQGTSTPTGLDQAQPTLTGGSVSTPLAPSGSGQASNRRRGSYAPTAPSAAPASSSQPRRPATLPVDVAHTEGARLRAIEGRFLVAIQATVFGGVILLTVGAGMLSWSHLTHVAATNGHIAPPGLLFVFPTIVDGFMVMGSAVVMRHAITDKVGGRT